MIGRCSLLWVLRSLKLISGLCVAVKHVKTWFRFVNLRTGADSENLNDVGRPIKQVTKPLVAE